MYVFNGSDSALYSLIAAYTILACFLLVQMCRLCSKVFSYHKFHIHEAYRFYTVAFFSVVVVAIEKITQLKLNQKAQGRYALQNYEGTSQNLKVLNRITRSFMEYKSWRKSLGLSAFLWPTLCTLWLGSHGWISFGAATSTRKRKTSHKSSNPSTKCPFPKSTKSDLSTF